ncbi:LysR family transcriptional regulator [Nocardioides lianchengensis]|uniref:DNA-binding transcriptional regulator, LysR family n=1 Tax=Nocardioides lianchengensis TaxID=1045774 RepID=A0A1G6VYI9_9ACTN|nr:LysR family transcriptional regulator [Nocardioides lianchengensis]NYG11342.1 DNA-binding transcriptional LysR family regulator [Nocardioides lianchengensis]SDD58641.1 DNA-binding transcriptional regulator, LysR family [Nocardioides lianchengensis]
MRIEQLEYIAAVTQYGSLRKASESLHVSQPALSEAVSKLERELGVILLDRRRSGARISRRGRELLQNMVEVLEAVDRLRTAAGDQAAGHHVVRVGTVSAATSTVLVPAVRDFRAAHPGRTAEVLNIQQGEIDQGLREGALDLGLVNVLAGDDTPPDLVDLGLVHGRPVAVLPAGHPLASYEEVTTEQLRTEPFVAMRAGYLMHRFAHRLFGVDMPEISYTTDGAELGKTMVAEGLGVTVLPHYSVAGDPLERAGLITHRPLRHDSTAVTLVLRQRRQQHVPQPVRDLAAALVARARTQDGTTSPPVASETA